MEGWSDEGASWGFLDRDKHTTGLVSVFVLATVLGCSLNYTMFLCIRVNSALTTSLVGHAKTAVQTVVGFFLLAQDVNPTYTYVSGVTITSLGGLLFTLAKYHQGETKSGSIKGVGFWEWCLGTLLGIPVKQKMTRASLVKASLM